MAHVHIHIEDTTELNLSVVIYVIDRYLNGEPKTDLEGEYDIMIDTTEIGQEMTIKISGQNKSS